ncbi:FecR family protein [Chitinophaga parva]|nr:FecR domain-containing protein [Chitinophaga parva]
MDYSQYRIEDFACDESFQASCTGANPAQVLFWEEYARAHPEQAAVLEEARHLVTILSARQGNRLEQLQQLRQGMAQQAKLQALLGKAISPGAAVSGETVTPAADAFREAATTLRKPAGSRYLWMAGAAAAATLVLLITTFTFRTQHAHAIANTTFSAGSLPRKTVLLPDGSVITLRTQSKVTLDTGFNQSNRCLTLEGEAFFDVQHAAARPFVVHTPHADITVLGTRFNVSAYPGKATETALYRGQVSVQAQGAAPVVLSAHEKLVVGNGAPTAPQKNMPRTVPLQMQYHGGNAENAWVHNRLEIENESLKDIAARLEKWYGIPIVFEDNEVQQYRYSGTFESESIVEALQALQLSYHFNFTTNQDQIVIKK